MKRVINNTIICVIIINILIGCGILKSPADKSELEHDTSYWMNYDATRRGAIISVGKDGNVKMLSEPSPDVAVDLAQKYITKIDYKGIGAEGAIDVTEQIVQLGKRTSTIMFLRESLYRINELACSGRMDTDVKELFVKAMDATLKLASAELTQSEASLERAKVRRLEKVKVLKELGLTNEDLDDILD